MDAAYIKKRDALLARIAYAEQKYEEQEYFVSFVTFNSDGIKTVLDRAEALKAEDITSDQFTPACCIPLYDAIGQSVTELKKSVAENDKILVTIITDGYENASRERWFSRIADNDANANENFFDEK